MFNLVVWGGLFYAIVNAPLTFNTPVTLPKHSRNNWGAPLRGL